MVRSFRTILFIELNLALDNKLLDRHTESIYQGTTIEQETEFSLVED